MAVVLWDEYKNDSLPSAPPKEPVTAGLGGALGLGTSNPLFPWASVDAEDPLGVAVVLVNLALPESPFPV